MNEKPDQESSSGRDRELLSALMDGETSELELHRALKATEQEPELAATWRRYHLAQLALRGERRHVGADMRGIDLRDAVRARIDAEDAQQQGAATGAEKWRSGGSSRFSSRVSSQVSSWLRPFGRVAASAAVAASVAMATVFAWQAFDAQGVSGSRGDAVAAADTKAGQHVTVGPMVVLREDGEEVVASTPSASLFSVAPTSQSPTAEQDRLNAYLTRHAQVASSGGAHGLAPYARVVSLEREPAQ